MSQSEQLNEIAVALAKAQGQIKNPTKNRTAKVITKTGTYTFRYADLTAVIDAIRAPLAENNLSYVQFIEEGADGKYRLVTKLMHGSGQWIESRNPLFLGKRKDRDGNELPPGSQEFGSAQTFMKRYALTGMLGVSADEDDDANIADGNQAQFENSKRENPNINKPGDFVDKAEYIDGDIDQPVNNIPRGNQELKRLGKKDADVLINNLRVKMKYATNKMALKAWGEQVRDEVETLPDQHRVQIREDYADRWNELP